MGKTEANEWVLVEEDPCTTPKTDISRDASLDQVSDAIPDLSIGNSSVAAGEEAAPVSGKKKKRNKNNKKKAAAVSEQAPAPEPAQSRKSRMAAMKEAKAVQERLWNACKVGSLDGVKRALEAGGDLHAVDDREGGDHEHVPAIVLAAVEGSANVIEFLLDAKADIEGCNTYGVTALMEAATSEVTRTSEKGKAKVLAAMELLIARGANVHAVDCDNESVIFKAAQEGCTTSVKVLLNRGADPKVKDKKGRDAAQIAEAGGHDKLAMLLKLVSK